MIKAILFDLDNTPRQLLKATYSIGNYYHKATYRIVNLYSWGMRR